MNHDFNEEASIQEALDVLRKAERAGIDPLTLVDNAKKAIERERQDRKTFPHLLSTPPRLHPEEQAQLDAAVKCVMQTWSMRIPPRAQTALLEAVRFCDDTHANRYKNGQPVRSPSRQLTQFIRWCFLHDVDDPDFMRGSAPDIPWNPVEFEHLPLRWFRRMTEALKVISYYHPSKNISDITLHVYQQMSDFLLLNIETKEQALTRFSLKG
jgi:hypothetical protein